MAFSDRNTTAAAAIEVREIMERAARHAAGCTLRLRQLVNTYTRAALAAELGADAAAMLSLYNKLEDFRATEMGDGAVPLPA